MIELSKHIKALLLENDCVIIPGLGGFIAHNRPAIYEKETNTFLAPMRTIGFNPQLTINDGVLVQSYMEAYDTDFPDATRRIEKAVGYIKEVLYTDGRAELNDIGTIYYNVNGSYEFEPFQNAFFSPALYGLDNFRFPKLKKAIEQKTIATNYDIHPLVPTIPHSQQNHSYRQMANFVIKNAVAVAAAILLFFVMSIQVENTYVDDANYASIGSIGIFHSIKDYSAATMDLTKDMYCKADMASATHNQPESVKQIVPVAKKKQKAQVKPVAIRTEMVTPKQPAEATTKKPQSATSSVESVAVRKMEKAEAVQPKVTHTVQASQPNSKSTSTHIQTRNTKGYYIIISSLPNRQSAEKQLSKFREAGCRDAMILESDGRFRIAYNRYADKSQAYKDINVLKQQDNFKSAWVYCMK